MNKRTLSIAIAYLLATVTVVTYYPTLFNHIINWSDGELFSAVSAVAKGREGLLSQSGYGPLTLAFLVFERSFSDTGIFFFTR